MTGNRHNNKPGNSNVQPSGNRPKPKTDKPPEWLSKELIVAADHDGDMFGKLARAVMSDEALLEDLKYAPDGRRNTLLRQLKTKLLSARKSERSKANDKVQAATTPAKNSGKLPKLVVD